MSTIKVDTIATRTGSGNITASNTIAGTSATLSGTLGVTGAMTGTTQTLNRSGNGVLQAFQTDGTAVGQIDSSSGNLLIRTNGDKSGIRFDTNSLTPFKNGSQTDNAVDLGFANARFKDLYLSSGLYVGGTGAANHLDDYEEGAFTPAKNNGGSVSYSQQNGYYIKVGRLVTVNIDIIISSASSESSSAAITLPFTTQNTSPSKPAYMAFIPWIVDTNFTTSNRKAAGFVNEGVAYMFMYQYNSYNNSGYAYANQNTTGRWSGVIQYYTA